MAKRLKFYDLKERESFSTSNYKIKSRTVKGKKRKFAVAKSPMSKNEYWRALPKDFKQ